MAGEKRKMCGEDDDDRRSALLPHFPFSIGFFPIFAFGPIFTPNFFGPGGMNFRPGVHYPYQIISPLLYVSTSFFHDFFMVMPNGLDTRQNPCPGQAVLVLLRMNYFIY